MQKNSIRENDYGTIAFVVVMFSFSKEQGTISKSTSKNYK